MTQTVIGTVSVEPKASKRGLVRLILGTLFITAAFPQLVLSLATQRGDLFALMLIYAALGAWLTWWGSHNTMGWRRPLGICWIVAALSLAGNYLSQLRTPAERGGSLPGAVILLVGAVLMGALGIVLVTIKKPSLAAQSGAGVKDEEVAQRPPVASEREAESCNTHGPVGTRIVEAASGSGQYDIIALAKDTGDGSLHTLVDMLAKASRLGDADTVQKIRAALVAHVDRERFIRAVGTLPLSDQRVIFDAVRERQSESTELLAGELIGLCAKVNDNYRRLPYAEAQKAQSELEIRIRAIGEELSNKGGMKLMLETHALVAARCQHGRYLEGAWDGIGSWRG